MSVWSQEDMVKSIQALDLIADGSTKDVNRGFATVIVSIGDRKVLENGVYAKEHFTEECAEQYLRERGLMAKLDDPAA